MTPPPRRRPVLYFLLDLPGERPLEALSRLLPRLAAAWPCFDLVQLRAKAAPASTFVRALQAVRGAASRGGRGAGPPVLANDRLDAALAAGADGVHVGADDLPPEAIRDAGAPEGFLVGLTCHTLAELAAAPGRCADYVGAGAFFPSATKPGRRPDPRSALAALPPEFPLPVYAIGGITLDRVGEVLETPLVSGVVVSAAIQSAADPAAAARAFRERLDSWKGKTSSP